MDKHTHTAAGPEMPNSAVAACLERAADDARLLPSHISLLMALFHCSRDGKGNTFQSSRSRLMRFSRIRSIATYHKCIRELVDYGYITYVPSWHPFRGSRFGFVEYRKTNTEGYGNHQR